MPPSVAGGASPAVERRWGRGGRGETARGSSREAVLHATVLRQVPEPSLADRAEEPRSTTVPLEEERAVVARLRHGDRAAFAILYRWYGDAIWRVVLARLPEREVAEDCLRDTFRAALEKLEQFKDEGQSIFWWIRRIAIHKAMDAHRLRKRDRELADRAHAQPETPGAGQAPPRPDRGVEVAETARDVQVSLSRLNERYAEVLRLRLIEDRTREECAERLGITIGNLDVLLHRACKAFRKVYPP